MKADRKDSVPGVVIRGAVPSDIPILGRLGALLVRTHHDLDPNRFIAAMPGTEKGYGAFLGRQLEEENIIVQVAEQGGEVIGYTYAGVEDYDYMSLRGPAGVLYDIVVDPAHRERGVGSLLLEAAISALKQRGAPRVILDTAEKNTSAQRLFDRAGFRRTMIEMTRELSDSSGLGQRVPRTG